METVPGRELAHDLRQELEAVLHRLAQAGKIADRGERDLRIRLTPEGQVRWYECVRRVPGGELASGFDESAGAVDQLQA